MTSQQNGKNEIFAYEPNICLLKFSINWFKSVFKKIINPIHDVKVKRKTKTNYKIYYTLISMKKSIGPVRWLLIALKRSL